MKENVSDEFERFEAVLVLGRAAARNDREECLKHSRQLLKSLDRTCFLLDLQFSCLRFTARSAGRTEDDTVARNLICAFTLMNDVVECALVHASQRRERVRPLSKVAVEGIRRMTSRRWAAMSQKPRRSTSSSGRTLHKTVRRCPTDP